MQKNGEIFLELDHARETNLERKREVTYKLNY